MGLEQSKKTKTQVELDEELAFKMQEEETHQHLERLAKMGEEVDTGEKAAIKLQ